MSWLQQINLDLFLVHFALIVTQQPTPVITMSCQFLSLLQLYQNSTGEANSCLYNRAGMVSLLALAAQLARNEARDGHWQESVISNTKAPFRLYL